MDKVSPTKLVLRGETEELHQYANLLSQLSVDDIGLLMRSTKLEGWEANPRKQLLVTCGRLYSNGVKNIGLLDILEWLLHCIECSRGFSGLECASSCSRK